MRYLFENLALDTDRRELRRGDASIAVEPQVFDLLAYLIENRHRVVSRDDLIAQVWDGRIVSESALARCINGARSAIGDSGDIQRLIKTLPRKGLRFVGSVREEQEIAAAAIVGVEEPTAALSLPDRPSIVVLPLENLSGDKEQDYFCEGITDDIITELSRFWELFVIARNSSFQYRGRAIDVRQVGRELGVRYVLQGSIRRIGDRVRISVQLADAMSGTHRWAERYDRQIWDVFAVQEEMARTIVTILAAYVNKAEIERSLSKPPATWQAYDHYLRAAHAHTAFLSSFKATELYAVRQLLQQSLEIDPNYARACAKLAWTHLAAWISPLDDDYLNPSTLERGYGLARKAVQLAPNLSEAHAVLGHILARRGEHDAAVAAVERAMALNPNLTDWRFAEVLVLSGEPVRAIALARRHMRLDPFYVPLAPGWLGLGHYMLKAYAEALPPLRECAARAPGLRASHFWLAAAYAQLGRLEEARNEAAETLRIDPKLTINGTIGRLFSFKRADDREHFFDGMRKAGLPEK